MLDRRLAPPDQFGQGIYKLLRLFIDWFPSADCAQEPEFVLPHPDLDLQNILISPEGELRGIIDWDGVGAVPRCVGNERYLSQPNMVMVMVMAEPIVRLGALKTHRKNLLAIEPCIVPAIHGSSA